MLLGIPAQEISSLLEIARKSAQATGQSVSQAFDDIATGIGRASPLILDNLGITVKVGDANARYAAELGKTVEQLTAAEQKQALLNAVLAQGETAFAGLERAVSPVGRELDRLNAEWDDVIDGTSKSAANSTLLAKVFGTLTSVLQQTRFALGDWLQLLGLVTEEETKARAETRELGDQTEELAESVGQASGAWDEFRESLAQGVRQLEREARAKESQRETTEQVIETESDYTESIEASTFALREQESQLVRVRTELERTGQQAAFTAAQFDALARSQGRAAAEEAAIAAGSEVILGGTRIRLPGGGSRLVTSSTRGGQVGSTSGVSYRRNPSSILGDPLG